MGPILNLSSDQSIDPVRILLHTCNFTEDLKIDLILYSHVIEPTVALDR